MAATAFDIVWKDGHLVYRPEPGLLEDVRLRRVVSVRNGAAPDPASVPFRPVCLTLFAGGPCNLRCAYCYGPDRPDAERSSGADPAAVFAAAERVAGHCAGLGLPLTVGFHGDTEPLLQPEWVSACIDACEKAAAKFGLTVRPHCTTNGVLSGETAAWAAAAFHGITLSWDGSPEIQDRQRPLPDGRPSSPFVLRTHRIWLNRPAGLRTVRIRATVTSGSADSFPASVRYLHGQGVRWIEAYPAYRSLAGTVDETLRPDADRFIRNFLTARAWAERRGTAVLFSGNRPSDRHGRHCAVFQENLTMTADGRFTACFQATSGSIRLFQPFFFGGGPEAAEDSGALETLRAKLAEPPSRCADCLHRLHCSMGCPDHCPLEAGPEASGGFDCRISHALGLAALVEAAGYRVPAEAFLDPPGYSGYFRIAPREPPPRP
jgi:radical SAM protein with 4Fe4S-binding SPASM domain